MTISPAKVLVFFASVDKSEALETMETVNEILVERGFITENGEKKKGRTPGTRSKAKAATMTEAQE